MDNALLLIIIGLAVAIAGWGVMQARSAQSMGSQASVTMIDAFKAASQEALAAQSAQLVQLADARYGALHQNTDTVLAGHGRAVDAGLKQLADRLAGLERERLESTTALRTVVTELTAANLGTQAEAAKLASALRDNRVRGMWGEVQLRRVLEMAGLQRHVDFVEQRDVSDRSTSGRPDVVVPLANGRVVIIDSKVPLDRYLDAANASHVGDLDAERVMLVAHAKAVAGHVHALAQRDYAAKVSGSVDMVLLFLPGDQFLAAALDADPSLFETASAKHVYLVTPSSLLPVLRGIALGWREYQAEQAAADIQQLGIELYERIAVFASHHAAVGAQLAKTVEAYNKSVGSMDTRVVASARRLAEFGAGSTRPVVEPTEVDVTCRTIRLLDRTQPADAAPPVGIAAVSSSSALSSSSAVSSGIADVG